ncbi:DUF2927 domain-containing protein, partial [Aeromonas caviae]|uniref:DUF2927 domain-containing protein n=1 Tax=Aeromonas caviae TaxID=648 RepID=UPI00214E64F5|nr:DUF2927 domain-containing protein [Aeromonas caviae]
MNSIARWPGPVRLKLVNEFGDKPLQAEVVKVQTRHLSRITGHPIEIVSDNPNLTLIMTRHKQLTSSPTLALRVTGGGFPLLGDSCSR